MSTSVYTSSVNGSFTFPELSFVFGTPNTFFLDLGAATGSGVLSTSGSNLSLANFTAVTGSGLATADASDTLVLSQLLVEDQFGAPVSGATFSSASGTVYSANGVVPEPSAAILVVFGIAILGVFRRGRQISVEEK
jgi:hypothetical protein